VLAITSAVTLAATGPLVATVHMTSWQQFLTIPYGWTLAVKIECFLLMVSISTYHAFFLRPQLAQELAPSTPGGPEAQVELAPASVVGRASTTPGVPEMPSSRAADHDDERKLGQMRDLSEQMEVWLQREAALGIAVLLCTALLDVVFAGTLTPPI
jgi:putative copper export protein